MILSLNSGGRVDFENENYKNFKKGDFSLYPENHYNVNDYPFSKKICMLFEGNMKLLENSMIATVLLFRSKSFDYWRKENPKEKRILMEEFAYSKVIEIMEKMKPKKLLVIGMATFNKL